MTSKERRRAARDRRHGRSPGASVCRPDLGARKDRPCREQSRPSGTRDRRSRTMPRRRPCHADGNGRAQTLGVTGSEGFPSRELFAVADQHVEGVELHFIVVPARVQPIEVGPAVDAEQHGLAIDHERAVAVSERRR